MEKVEFGRGLPQQDPVPVTETGIYLVTPDVNAFVDALPIAEESKREELKIGILQDIYTGYIVINAVNPKPILEEFNLRRLNGAGTIEARAELFPEFARDENTGIRAVKDVSVLSTASLFYDAGYNQGAPLIGRLAIGMTSDGNWGVVINLNSDERQITERVNTRISSDPLAKLWHIRVEDDKPIMRVQMEDRVEIGSQAIDALRLQSLLALRDKMTSPTGGYAA